MTANPGRHGLPNILLVMADQLSALATSPYGNDEVLTPHMDALAQRGTLFENTYCNAPLCAPSRASMMTGMLPGQIPVDDNFEELPAAVPTFAHHLRRRGYRTVLSGKMHFVGPDQMHGFEERLTTDIYPSDFLGSQDWETLGDPPRPPAVRNGNPMARMVPGAGPVKWSTQLDYDEEVHFRALERLRQFARRPSEEQSPWFMTVSFTQPHDPYSPAQEYWDRYEGRHISLPSDGPAGAEPTVWDRWVNAYQGVDMVDTSPEVVRRLRRAYYAMVSYIDDKLGELVAELERLGELENTVVVLTSDHGDMVGEHGMFFKRTFREWSSRVPLVFAGPGIAEGERVERGSSLLDMFPTLVSLGGAMDDYELDQSSGRRPGRDLFGPGAAEPVVIDYNANGVITPTRTVVIGRMKYVYVHGHEELLFDLEQDPDEWHDVSGSPEYAGALEELRAACMDGWDPEEVHGRILQSQRRRAFVGQALAQGQVTNWDYQPFFDATRQHMRRPAGPVWDRSYTDQANPLLGGG